MTGNNTIMLWGTGVRTLAIIILQNSDAELTGYVLTMYAQFRQLHTISFWSLLNGTQTLGLHFGWDADPTLWVTLTPIHKKKKKKKKKKKTCGFKKKNRELFFLKISCPYYTGNYLLCVVDLTSKYNKTSRLIKLNCRSHSFRCPMTLSFIHIT